MAIVWVGEGFATARNLELQLWKAIT